MPSAQQPLVDPAREASEADFEQKRTYHCDHCDRTFEGHPAGSGLLIWTRGEEVRYEEPPLCDECASNITVGALLKWEVEEEEEG
jgi:hypothetical protein